jgi:DNA (cytosine-5)-methyltransferase 1
MEDMNMVPKIVAVDLFCGVGGLTHGLRKAGINVVAGYDIDTACKWPFEKNNGIAKFHQTDVAKLDGNALKKHFEDFDGISLLAGCAPCQPFSTYSLNKTEETDQRWSMLEHFGRLVVEAMPTLVTMENVAQVHKHNVFKRFVATLESAGYSTSIKVVKCADYGVPQSRARLVLLASLLGEIKLRERDPRRDKKRTVRQTISKLPSIKAGQICDSDPLHRTSSLSELNYKRILAASPGGSWRDWEAELVAACHQEESGKTFAGVYGRMEWDKPSPTITTQFFGFGNGRFGHPQQHRALSLREGALLQTFPAKYKFVKKGDVVRMKTVGRLIGNAVPVRLGQVIGESLAEHVRSLHRES